jgi:hypothetical protein
MEVVWFHLGDCGDLPVRLMVRSTRIGPGEEVDSDMLDSRPLSLLALCGRWIGLLHVEDEEFC